MWFYLKRYFPYAVLAVLCMGLEVFSDLLLPDVMRGIVDEGVLGVGRGGTGDPGTVLRQGLLMAGLVAAGAAGGALNSFFVNFTAQYFGNSVRKALFSKLMSFSVSREEAFGSGTLITRSTNDINQIQRLVGYMIRGSVRTLLMLFGSLWFMYRINGTFGLIVLCTVPFMVSAAVLCLRRVKPLFPKLQAQVDRLNEVMEEDISGIRTVKACARELYEQIRFGRANGEIVRTQLQTLFAFALLNPLMNIVMSLAVTALLYEGGVLSAAGSATPGEVMAGITYAGRLMMSVMLLVMISQAITRGLASWKRVKEVLDADPGMEDGEEPFGPGPAGSVEFRSVSFRYPEGASEILSDLSFSVLPGETLAVMGSTGCGKTTLASLVARLFDVTSGEVLVDGLDVRSFRAECLRKKVSAVLQKTELFSATVRENILKGNPEASDEEVRDAARAAQALSFIEALPDGFETKLSEQGHSLSGGQRQRLSLARAIIGKPEIMILDDATSALDLRTEAKFYSSLEEVLPDVTKIIVAQRIGTARRADRILILESGRLSDIGTHDELMRRSAVYREIAASQTEPGDEF